MDLREFQSLPSLEGLPSGEHAQRPSLIIIGVATVVVTIVLIIIVSLVTPFRTGYDSAAGFRYPRLTMAPGNSTETRARDDVSLTKFQGPPESDVTTSPDT
ncbi:uncharacterized protein LOC135398336 [Ornithodoros turicata]|uniref:uncharacterized protein LOC135398336 n=1 Tax=Ornithodoros turicata TaxID=34597 RepID=UPI003139DA1E